MATYVTQERFDEQIQALRVEFGTALQELVDMNLEMQADISRIKDAIRSIQGKRVLYLSGSCASAAYRQAR
jgi:hypothetical protein